MLVAVVASIALALPSLRVSGDYLLIASIGFQLGLLEVIKNLRFTGGAGGLHQYSAVPDPRLRPRELRGAGAGGDARA